MKKNQKRYATEDSQLQVKKEGAVINAQLPLNQYLNSSTNPIIQSRNGKDGTLNNSHT